MADDVTLTRIKCFLAHAGTVPRNLQKCVRIVFERERERETRRDTFCEPCKRRKMHTMFRLRNAFAKCITIKDQGRTLFLSFQFSVKLLLARKKIDILEVVFFFRENYNRDCNLILIQVVLILNLEHVYN